VRTEPEAAAKLSHLLPSALNVTAEESAVIAKPLDNVLHCATRTEVASCVTELGDVSKAIAGALARPAPGGGALPSIDAKYLTFAGGFAPTPGRSVSFPGSRAMQRTRYPAATNSGTSRPPM
jgi:hypothetical protein